MDFTKNITAGDLNALTPEEILAISPEVLDLIIEEGEYKGQTVAFRLAKKSEGMRLLIANENRLGMQITPATLNKIVESGPWAGESVAFHLACSYSAAACGLLTFNNNELGRQITPATLNKIVESGPWAGQSVAFWLAMLSDLRPILLANDNRLGLQITSEVLNKRAKSEGCVFDGFCVAYWLARFTNLLTAENYTLGFKIAPETLDFLSSKVRSKVTDLLAAIEQRDKNNKVMLVLFSAKLISHVGRNSALKQLSTDLISEVLTMLDGRIKKEKSKLTNN